MNKAFVREPEDDGPRVLPALQNAGPPGRLWPVRYAHPPRVPRKDAGRRLVLRVPALRSCLLQPLRRRSPDGRAQIAGLPHDPNTPICACFGLTYDDVEADVHDGTPTRIRELLAKSKSSEAQCHKLAADGICCMAQFKNCTCDFARKPPAKVPPAPSSEAANPDQATADSRRTDCSFGCRCALAGRGVFSILRRRIAIRLRHFCLVSSGPPVPRYLSAANPADNQRSVLSPRAGRRAALACEYSSVE